MPCGLFQEHMPFRDIYISAFKNDIEYSQLIMQTTAALQANKFMQVWLLFHVWILILSVHCVTDNRKCTISLKVCLLSSLCKLGRMSWISWGRRWRNNGRESRREWWVDFNTVCQKQYLQNASFTKRSLLKTELAELSGCLLSRFSCWSNKDSVLAVITSDSVAETSFCWFTDVSLCEVFISSRLAPKHDLLLLRRERTKFKVVWLFVFQCSRVCTSSRVYLYDLIII